VNADKLKGKLAENNISGVKLAQLLEVSPNTVYKWFKTGRIKSNYIKDIMTILNLTSEETAAIFLE
jgi:predicted site-specific integrase-resolvase